MLSDFKSRHGIKGKKIELERKFYEYYFKEVFDKYKIAFTFSSQKTKKGSNSICLFNPKTINAHYVECVMRSKHFEADFKNFIQHEFMKDYSRTRELKIKKVLEKCLNFFIESPEKGEAGVIRYIEENPKCKLPWSNKELDEALESVNILLNQKLPKSLKSSRGKSKESSVTKKRSSRRKKS